MPPSTMDNPEGDGPDGSSIKPVSSLRARFENMNKTAPTSSQSQPSSRPISPKPKPERLQNLKPASVAPTAPIKTPTTLSKPLDKPQLSATWHKDLDLPPPIPVSTKPPPPTDNSPATPLKTPSVTVQPPQSPPKGTGTNRAGDQSPFLDPKSRLPPTTPKPLKIPPPPPASRPRTPTPGFAAQKSPRLATSLPPSPPPPRRSGELKREKEAKAIPSPGFRNESSLAPEQQPFSLPEPRGSPFQKKGEILDEISPFNSPPESSDGEDHEPPPQLPTRPRPSQQTESTNDAKPAFAGFQPPPVHHAIADRRRDREKSVSVSAKGWVTDRNEDVGPALPTRPAVSEHQPQAARAQAIHTSSRSNSTAVDYVDKLSSSAPPSRSIPNHQLMPPPVRRHERSSISESRTDRAPKEIENHHQPIAATTKSIEAVSVPDQSTNGDSPEHVSTYPDGTNANRRPPYAKQGSYQVQTKYDARIFDVCGELVCTGGHLTRVWNLVDGEQIMSLSHTEGMKATALIFKPTSDPDEEGRKLWIGTNYGEIMEVDIATQRVTYSKPGVHGKAEVIRMLRHYNELWTLDEGGSLLVWGPDENEGSPNLRGHPAQIFKVPKGHTFSIVVGEELWHATGRTIRVFEPSLDGRATFQVLIRPLAVEGAGDVTSGTLMKSKPGKLFLGHVDGKVSIYSTKDYTCQGIVHISTWKINALASAGRYLWAGYNTGKIGIYDISRTPWVVKKEWQAHDNPVTRMKTDTSSPYRLDRLQVVSLGTDSKIKAWDGLLQDDWIEDEMKSKDKKYCSFSQVSAMVMTWNAGACTPYSLRYAEEDTKFVRELLQSSGSPDILIFGFQELVDLEDKTATAKRLLKSKKREGTDHEKMSHRYRDWRDFLLKTLDDYFPTDDLYHLLHNAPLVGLFTCVFVKASLRGRIKNLSGAEVKRGMGGLHGNKGAVTVRFQIDDTSLCFVNCHLAAGQSQANARHTDIAAILETVMFPVERDAAARIDTYTGGGDGSMILDHELCIVNGDLNYRVDTMSRDTVVKAVKQGNLPKLLDRDQLLVARRRNPTFKLRAFEEMPITFEPTYKYDVGTDRYDTSEKRRSPAWCDRILYRGRGRIQQLDYKRHEVRVSDHRPVSGNFRLWVKKVDPSQRAKAWMESQQGFEATRQREIADEKMQYLRYTCGFDEETCKQLIEENLATRTRRSPSRNKGDY